MVLFGEHQCTDHMSTDMGKTLYSNDFSNVNTLTEYLQWFYYISPVTYTFMEEATSLGTG